MSSAGAALRAAVPVSNARAEASRRNGARSRGPTTPEGKARSARNALKHGMRAQKHVVLPEEDAAEFVALEAALFEELAPRGVLERILVGRIARAAWRLDRAERLEVEVLEFRGYGGASPGLALIRDGNGTRSVDTVLRYRGAAAAELMRSLRTLKALQVEARALEAPASRPGHARAEPTLSALPARVAARPAPAERAAGRAPNEPDARGNPGESGSTAPPASEPSLAPARIRPDEPEPLPAARLARLQREVEGAIQAAAACGAFDCVPGSERRRDRRRTSGRPAAHAFAG